MARIASGSLVTGILLLAVAALLAATTTRRLTPIAHDNLALVETLQRIGGTGTPSELPAAAGGFHARTFRSPWNAIKALLALGDYAGAAALAPALKPQIGQDELRYYYVLTAAQRAGRNDLALDLYETMPPPQPAATISDTVFLSYVQRGQPGDFERALALQPNSLISHYHLWRQALAAGDQEAAAEHLDRLTYFPIEVFEPTNQELAEAIIDLASTLTEDGVWNQERLMRTAAYLVFRQPKMPAVENLVTRWAARQGSNQADWLSLLAELYHRRNELAPGDPVAMQAWDQVCTALKQLDPAAGQSRDCIDAKSDALAAQAEIRAEAAGLLKAPPENVQVGPNQVLNGGMEEWGFRMPVTWFFSNQAAWDSESNRGVVILTDDRLDAPEGSTAARFDALALEQNPGKEAARYSLVTRPSSAIQLEPGQWYAIALDYRTEDMAGMPVTVDLVDTQMGDLGIEQEQLPATGGRWARHVFLRRFEGDRPHEALLWLRGWQTGRVWFDDVSLQAVEASTPSSGRNGSRVTSG